MNHPTRATNRRKPGGFSLTELLATVAVVGVLSGISIQSYHGLRDSARESAARDTLALLNRALLHFDQANWDVVLTPVPDATSDELAILRTLQYRNASIPGSPYLPSNFDNVMSSSEDDYRIQWAGHTFELLAPGTPGAGIKTGSDIPSAGTVYTYPPDYQPLTLGQHE
ncbi:MAG: prepilin-type N-terminal cleavage/methylation domain-containing protein [Terrimicrobiaceae bacterium]|nr:prepilin-type N-terminal cleavage/methylation domain-containing protein [Terrimicrobiaceae bacterium]